MNIITINPAADGHHSIVDTNGKFDGWATVDCDMSAYYAYKGFVNITVVGGVCTAIVGNQTAYDDYIASLPDPEPLTEPEPTPQDDTDALVVDHEYRITMLELGLTEEGGNA